LTVWQQSRFLSNPNNQCCHGLQEKLRTCLEDFFVWYLPHLESFPRNCKFLLGDRRVNILISASSA